MNKLEKLLSKLYHNNELSTGEVVAIVAACNYALDRADEFKIDAGTFGLAHLRELNKQTDIRNIV